MSHYFSNDEYTIENRREISFRFLGFDFTLTTDDGVFSKNHLDKGTEILLESVSELDLYGKVCDLGCGIGVIGVILSKLFDIEMLGVDVNPKAVRLANENYLRYEVKGENILSDGVKGEFDFVISNPPIRVGKDILYRLFEDAYDSLKVGGSFVFVIRKQHGAKSAEKEIERLFGNCEMINRKKGYHIYRANKID